MTFNSLLEIIGATSVWLAISTVENVNVIHSTNILSEGLLRNPGGLRPPKVATATEGGDDVPKLEPKRLNFRGVDKMMRDLRRIYKENPALFNVPIFARKVY